MIRYRIIVGSSPSYPYCVEKKRFSWIPLWVEIDSASSLESAERKLREYLHAKIPPEGTILRSYTDEDITVELLRQGGHSD